MKPCVKCGATERYGRGQCAPCTRTRENARNRTPVGKVRKAGYRFKRVYGLSHEALFAMRERQGNRCAVCRDALRPGRGTHIDHDHDTGQVRGLLCRACNLAEGNLRGSALRARRLAAYLEAHAPRLTAVRA